MSRILGMQLTVVFQSEFPPRSHINSEVYVLRKYCIYSLNLTVVPLYVSWSFFLALGYHYCHFPRLLPTFCFSSRVFLTVLVLFCFAKVARFVGSMNPPCCRKEGRSLSNFCVFVCFLFLSSLCRRKLQIPKQAHFCFRNLVYIRFVSLV